MDSPERLSLQSADGVQLNLDALYQIAPSCFTEAADPKTGKIKRMVNFDTLRQLLGDDSVEDAPEAYEFNWVGKQAARAEVLRPINKTLRPVKEDSVDWDNTQNLYIEGDNLEVLKLLQKSYLGKVKMIYIDPPYNTGNDFVYHDDFARSHAEEDLFAGNVDELGNRYRKNTDSNGKYHSDWCSMIYSRLMVARSLLAEDGVIFISIDENECSNLQKICNEIFGAYNYITQFVWQNKKGGGNDSVYVAMEHEYVLTYAKNKSSLSAFYEKYSEEYSKRYKEKDEKGKFFWDTFKRKSGKQYYPITCPDGTVLQYDEDGNPISWLRSEKRFLSDLNDKEVRIVKLDKGWSVQFKQRMPEGKKPRSIFTTIQTVIDDKGTTSSGSNDCYEYFKKDVFSNPKPLELISYFLGFGVSLDDIVLDFFSGSGTTADALFRLNVNGMKCKFILVQLPEDLDEILQSSSENAKRIADNAIKLCDEIGVKHKLTEVAKERIRRAGKKIKEESPLTTQDLDTGFRVFRVDSSNYEEVEHTPKDWNQQELDLFLNNIKSDRTDLDLLFGCMLDWGVQLSLPMTTEEVDGKNIYTVNEGDLVACFAEKVTDNVVRAMADKQPLRVIFRDSCFERDADKINIYETFKQLLDWSDQEVVKNIRVI